MTTSIKTLAGQNYNTARGTLETIDFDGVYPEVDLNGVLTGNTIAATSMDHEIVDILESGDVVGGVQRSDAMLSH